MTHRTNHVNDQSALTSHTKLAKLTKTEMTLCTISAKLTNPQRHIGQNLYFTNTWKTIKSTKQVYAISVTKNCPLWTTPNTIYYKKGASFPLLFLLTLSGLSRPSTRKAMIGSQ